jgi:hypothetical protein
VKPGWGAVLFAGDNTDTETTVMLTSTNTVDTSTTSKLVSTVTFNSEGPDDAYDVNLYFDNMFGTYAILDVNSPALKAGAVSVASPLRK